MKLSPRQREIVQLVGEGYTYHEVAEILDIAFKTVEAHIANICRRVETDGRRQREVLLHLYAEGHGSSASTP